MTGRGFVGASHSADGRGGVMSTCLACGRDCKRGESYCRSCRPKRRSAVLRGGGHTIARFRHEAFAQAGNQCDVVIDGVRCSERGPRKLEAHHVVPVSRGGANVAGNALLCCVQCHRIVEALAEAAKLRD